MKKCRRKKPSQTIFLPRKECSYGGELMKSRRGRSGPRPLSTRSTMHLVLRSSKATGLWSFKVHSAKIRKIVNRFAHKYGVKIIMQANVGNHLHFHIKIGNRNTYKPFIRGLTAAICMAVTGASRWKPLHTLCDGKFWDRRPFTRIVRSFTAFTRLNKYIELNQLEGCGLNRSQARYVLAREWDLRLNTS